EREQRLARQKAMGLVPPDTRMPARNDGVKAWVEHSDDEQRVFTRLQSAFAGMLDHADQHLARLVAFLDAAGVRDNTLIIVMSDNGASQEGGPLGFINAMGPYNLRPEPMAEKVRRIDDIGGPDTHTNFPHGWAMASNTPLRRYKQNTHGGGIRDPFIMSWPKGIAKGELRHQFVHACDSCRRCSISSASAHRRRSPAVRRCRSRARALRARLWTLLRRQNVSRNISRCLAIAASGTRDGRRSPSILPARLSRTTNGSCSISIAISPRPTISPKRSRSGSPR